MTADDSPAASPASKPGPFVCASCGAGHDVMPTARCWVCDRPFVLAAAPMRMSGPPAPAPRARERWESLDTPRFEWAPVLVSIFVIGGVCFVQPGIGILLAICAVPLLVTGVTSRGAIGCLAAGAIAIGILIATCLAFVLTCTAVYRGSGGHDGDVIGLLAAVAVFVGLTVLVARLANSRRRRAAAASHRPTRRLDPPFD